MVKEFILLEETDDSPRRIVINLRHVTAFHLEKKENASDVLNIYLRADDSPYKIEGKDARRIFDELKIHLTREGLL